MKSIIGKKVGMTSIFDTNGKQTAVTIIEAGPCVVTQKKTTETDGYNALQIAFGDKKEKHTLNSANLNPLGQTVSSIGIASWSTTKLRHHSYSLPSPAKSQALC